MAIRKITSGETIVLDGQTPQTQKTPRLRKIAPDEDIMLDQERAMLDPRATTPVYYPQQEADTSLIGHVKSGGVDAARRMYGLSANVLDKAADKADELEFGIRNKYYELFGYPEHLDNQVDELTVPEQNIVSRNLRSAADSDSQSERILQGKINAMNVQDTVSWEDVKNDPISLDTGRFILEQGARSLPEMAVAFIPYVGLPAVAGTTSQAIMEDRLNAEGLQSNDMPSDYDMQAALAFGGLSAGLERFGVLGDVAGGAGGSAARISGIRQIPGAMARSGAGEAGTEFIQEGTEYVGGSIGTDNEPTVGGFVERGIQGALVGGPMGATVRGVTELATSGGNTQTEDQQLLTYDPQPTTAKIELPPNKLDLEEAIKNDTPLPQSKTVEIETTEIDPVLQAQGYILGVDAEQVDSNGEVFSGKITAAQEVDGELEVTVMDQNGELRTLFSSDGEISVPPVPQAVTEDIPQGAPIEAAQSDTFGLPEVDKGASSVQEITQKPVIKPDSFENKQNVKKLRDDLDKRYAELTEDQLINVVMNAKMKAKETGWNKLLIDVRNRAQKELDTRFPQQSGTLQGVSSIDKPVSDSVLADTNIFGNSPNAKTFISEGFNSLDINAQHVMLSKVVSSINNDKIFRAIVESVPVDVMNMLIGQQISPQDLLNNKSMLSHRLSISSDVPIPQSVVVFMDSLSSSLKRGLARSGAEKSGLPFSGTETSADGSSTASTGMDKSGRHIHSDVVNGTAISVDIKPTEKQKEAGNYLKGSVSIQNLPITIENPAGSIRTGTDKDGETWQTEMPAHYGYIKRTEGADGDQVDVYIGQKPSSDKVFVIDQINPEDQSFDEHKSFVGFENADQVKAVYDASFSDSSAIKRYGGMKEFTVSEFKDWLKNSNNKRPVAWKAKKITDRTDEKVAQPIEKPVQPKTVANNTQKIERGSVGMMLREGQIVITVTGRQTTPFPRFKTKSSGQTTSRHIKAVDQWLISNALDEARSRGDDFNARQFEAELTSNPKSYPQATKDSAEYYLFDEGFINENTNQDVQQSVADTENAQQANNSVDNQDETETPTQDGNAEQSEGGLPVNDNTENDGRSDTERDTAEQGSTPEQDKPSGQDEDVQGGDQKTSKKSVAGSQTPKPNTPSNDTETDIIEDFGEKLEGARKDVWESYRKSMKDDLPDDVSKITLSKHFPEPDYQKLIDSGVDIKSLAAVKAMRDEIPNKPRKSWKLKDWARKVKTLRNFSNEIIDGEYTVDDLIKRMRDENSSLTMFADKIEMYADLGYPAFTKAKDWGIGWGKMSMINGVKYDPPKGMWSITKGYSIAGAFDTKEEAVTVLRKRLLEEQESTTKKKTSLDLYVDRKTKKVFIAKKVAAGKILRLKEGFEDAKEARTYLRENYDELIKILEKKKDTPPERRESNNPRIGTDYRGGKDVTPEEFANEFGFRGVQFGNYVEQAKRAQDLNDAYDAMRDMAEIIGIPARAVSLESTLGLAFGARGKGGKNAPKAHYEPGHIVINLTKKSGAGSLGHEWFHALDDNFGKRGGSRYITESYNYPLDVRDEIKEAFKGIMQAIRKTGIRDRSKELDKTRSKDYWSTDIEMGARTFEAYLIHKAEEKGESNDYLANIVGEDAWKALTQGEENSSYPYPTKQELVEHIVPAFDNLFETIKTKETDKGIVMYSLGNRAATNLQSTLLNAANDLKQEKGRSNQFMAMLKKASGVKEEEIAWTGLDEFLKGNKSVTKQEIVDYLNENQVQIEEVTMGKGNLNEPYTIEYTDTNNAWAILKNGIVAYGGFDTKQEAEEFATRPPFSQTKFSQYTLPGGENYREVLLTLPTTPEEIRAGNKTADYAKKLREKYGERYSVLATKEEIAEYDRLQEQQEKISNSGKYKSSHFDQPNILAHVRLNDRTTADGKRVLFIEEIQSDWHQAGRKKGYKEKADKYTPQFADQKKKDAISALRKVDNLGFETPVEALGEVYLASDEGKSWTEIWDVSDQPDIIPIIDEYIEIRAYFRNRISDAVPDAPFKKTWHEMAFRRVAQMAAQNGYDAIAWTPGEVQNERYDLSKTVETIAYWKNDIYPEKYDFRVDMIGTMDSVHKKGKTLEEIEEFVGKDIAQKISNGEGNKVDSRITEISGDGLKVGGEGMKGFYDKILKNYAAKFGKKYGSNVGVQPLLMGNVDENLNITDSDGSKIKAEDADVKDVWILPITDNMRVAADAGLELFSKTGAIFSSRRSFKNRADIESTINKRLNQLGFPAANVRLFENPADTGLPYTDETVEGAYFRGLVYVSLNAQDPIGALDHEVLHALKDAGAFTAQEWSILEKKAPEWRKKYNIDEGYGDLGLSEARLNEEAIAHALQDYGNKGIIRRIANKIAKFVKAIKQILYGSPYNFTTYEDVFDSILGGNKARTEDLPSVGMNTNPILLKRTTDDTAAADEQIMYSLPRSKKKAIEEATKMLDNVSGLERNIKNDLKKVSAVVLHPHQIASIDKSFARVYRAVVERFKKREVMIHQLGKYVDTYNRLPQASKDRVNAVLEIGRLSRKTYKTDTAGQIRVKNDGLDAVHSKDGDEVVLNQTEAAAYTNVRKMFDKAFDEYIATILEDFGLAELGAKTIQDVEKLRLKAVQEKNYKDAGQYKDVLQTLYEAMEAKKGGYIPLKRWGEVGVSVKNEDGEVVHFERIELPKYGKKAMIGENKAVQDVLDKLTEKYDQTHQINFFQMPTFLDEKAFVDLREFDVLLANSGIPESDKALVREVLQKEMQKRGFRSHFFRAKDVAGYDPDFERAINDYVVSISSYVARRVHEREIDAALSSISGTGKSNLYKYAEKYIDYVNDPQEELAIIRSAGFFWYLAGNVSSGLVNLSQPFLVTAPWFSGAFSHGQIAQNMTKAYAETASMLSFSQGMDMFDFSKAPTDIRDALIKAYELGDFLSLATQDAMAISNSNTQALRGLEKKKRLVAEGIALTFSIPEKTNRIVTFISAYRMALDPKNREKINRFIGKDELGKSMVADAKTAEEFAFAFAEYAVVSTQYRVGRLNRPQLTRGYGTLVFQFWSFIMQTFEVMYRLGNVHGGKNKQALAAMMLAVVAVAGLKGIPFEDDLQDIIEKLHKFKTGTDIDIETAVRDFLSEKTSPLIAETLIKGAPASLLNIDLSGRLGFGNVAPDRGADFLGVWWDMLYDRPMKSADYLNKGDVKRAIAESAPAFIRNPMDAWIWSKDGVRTKQGAKVFDAKDVTDVDKALKFFGFTSGKISTERDRIYARTRAQYAADDLRGRYYSRIAKAIAERQRLLKSGDIEGANLMAVQQKSIMDEINRYNQTVPLHKRVFPNQATIKQRVAEELEGADARKIRKQARQRVKEIDEIYRIED